ncbi:MAG TPA: 23S rRNA (pseudouridine(1915)-N(3))-methyltransferase RlmH [Parvularcula sp.]|nr:23S rRNA (pseudouridine(1915)-N(3))-methyltransferase RlmH [Parvularcula sp.]HBS31630.1 23S rRNA (pseudouridine(1915)-N(3))-methyltransferase RlmH [Parvularcula sp.]HBS33879.1 23S rRNA (pseudouridine(1915)-N(3))-methyltransferase RlmH [Parvularcula sp.]
MRLTVAAVGRLRGGPESDLIEEYASRIRGAGRAVGVAAFDISEVEAPKSLTGEKRQARESELLTAATQGARRIALDERGDVLTSADFAARIAGLRDEGAGEIAFLIGGADGHHRSLAPDMRLAFGRATFPHMLVRVMLAEQIYRAVTILAGHPYHRA